MKKNGILLFVDFLLDLIPALGGLIGKTSLVSSFALVWAAALDISTPNFVFDNVRLELMIGGAITLIVAFLVPNTAPSGTLAPLIVLIPAMAKFGVHPFLLSVFVGLLGILSIKTKVFSKLLSLAGDPCKTSLTLLFGISGTLLCAQKLIAYFGDRVIPLILLITTLLVLHFFLLRRKKAWLMIPFAVGISLALGWAFRIDIAPSFSSVPALQLNPMVWWDEIWGIGFGLDTETVLRTLPFALFVILLWTVDTASLQAILYSNRNKGDANAEELNINHSFLAVSVRNILGGVFGGAQTGSLWRSFLIPLYMMKRPIRKSAIMLGVIGLITGFTAIPIWFLSFPPLVWTVLLFGVFLPFLTAGIDHLRQATGKTGSRIVIALLAGVGLVTNPVLTWFGAIVYEKIRFNRKDGRL